MITGEIITAITLGLIGGLIPGPVITAVFTQILQAGYRSSLRIVFIALAVETCVALVSLLLITSLGLQEWVFRLLSFAGAAVLAWIAAGLWKVKTLDTGETVFFGPWKITIMILTNGVLWTYWITICIPRAVLLAEEIPLGDYLFMVLVQAGWLASTLLVSYVFSHFRKLLSQPRVIPFVFKVFAVIFIYFAADMTWKSLQFFLQR
jgi:threonine/homoserine/homoserine lactone efflux protein